MGNNTNQRDESYEGQVMDEIDETERQAEQQETIQAVVDIATGNTNDET